MKKVASMSLKLGTCFLLILGCWFQISVTPDFLTKYDMQSVFDSKL